MNAIKDCYIILNMEDLGYILNGLDRALRSLEEEKGIINERDKQHILKIKALILNISDLHTTLREEKYNGKTELIFGYKEKK